MQAKKTSIRLGCWIIVAIAIVTFSLVAACLLFLSTDGFATGWQKVFFASRDPFYTGASELDGRVERVPLIKPYEATTTYNWCISLQNTHTDSADPLYYYGNICDVTKIAVEKDLIMGFTPLVDKTSVVNWFVLIPDKKIEMGFANKGDFLKYIQSYGLQEPNWSTMDEFYQQFISTGCLDWIPDCKK